MICIPVSTLVVCVLLAMIVTKRYDLRRLLPPALFLRLDLVAVAQVQVRSLYNVSNLRSCCYFRLNSPITQGLGEQQLRLHGYAHALLERPQR